jgi:hypothetical protein
VLTKSDLVAQPILRLIWSLALTTLRQAKRLVFIGYSMPLTDIAASFLFREGTQHLDQASAIRVVTIDEGKAKLNRLVGAYKQVFPQITREQFDLSGAVQWVRDNLTTWLYDSRGRPIAFRSLGSIVSRDGHLIGTIRSYLLDRQDIWDGAYKGEIVNGNRFLRAEAAPDDDRGSDSAVPIPAVPRIPDPIAPFPLPPGYRDVELPS